MQDYLLSIIIPTKNRQYYCLRSVEQILKCCEDAVEIVIQDNSDDNSLESSINELRKNNIVYNHKNGTISFVDNFDMAIRAASGKYLMIIGDDDGITSLAIKAAEWADKWEISSIKPSLSFIYFWPGSKVFMDDDNGILNIYAYDGNIQEYAPEKGVKDLLKKSCQNYLDCDLVKLYHGIVRKDQLDKIKKTTGRVVGGLSPDIYLSVALSATSVGKAVRLNAPLTISGICTGSGSSQSVTGEHTGKLENAPHFKGHDYYEWDNRIPRFYSVETIWGDSALAAIKDLVPDYNRFYEPETLTYRCLRKYPKFKKEIMDSYYFCGGTGIKFGYYVSSRVINKVASKLLFSKNRKQPCSFKGLASISDASTVCEKWIAEHMDLIAFDKLY